MPGIFISYARGDDEAYVRRLHADLTHSGSRVWWDRKAMESRGATFLQELRDAIIESERLLLVIGPEAHASDYVRWEWEYALQICKPVVPVLRMGDTTLVPSRLKDIHFVDFRDDRAYEGALAELTRILRTPAAPLGALVAVPELPPHFLPRPHGINALRDALLADVHKPLVVTGAARRIGVHGMGGIGKSVLAAALARDCEGRYAFPGGVLWITLGPKPSLPLRQMQICEGLGDSPRAFEDVQQGKVRLGELLRDQACLLILDDLWLPEHVEAFDALGPRCRMLITTRDAGIITALGAVEHRMDVLSDQEAAALLAEWAGQEAETSSAEALEVARECGNLPLALALCGAQRRDGTPWADLLEALREADLEFLDHPHGSVMKSLRVSIDALPEDQARHYLDMAVFPPDESIPEAAVMTLWLSADGTNGRSARKLLSILERKALLRLAGRAPERRIALHDLQSDFIRSAQPDLPGLHGRLLEAYRRTCPNAWSSGPEDGYFFGHLAYHLSEAKQFEELFAIARDDEFLDVQSRAASEDPYVVLRTIQLAIEGASEIADAATMATFLLAHARRLTSISAESPVHALRAGSLRRAQELADLYDIERCVLWHLLLAWELRDTGKPAASRSALERLAEKRLPRFSDHGWAGQMAAHLLGYTVDAGGAAGSVLCGRLLEDGNRRRVCSHLAGRGCFAWALEAAQDIGAERLRDEALMSIAVSQGITGEITAACETAGKIGWKPCRVQALTEIAVAAAQLDRAAAQSILADAVSIARGVTDEKPMETTSLRIASAQARLNDPEAAKATFNAAIAFVQAHGFSGEKDAALGRIAVALAEAGDVESVLEMVRQVERTARESRVLFGAYDLIAEALAKAGELSLALETAEKIGIDYVTAEVVGVIAAEQSKVGDREAASLTFAAGVELAQASQRGREGSRALAKIAVAQAQVGEYASALETVDQVAFRTERAKLLGEIAMMRAHAGELGVARDCFAQALVASGLAAVGSRGVALGGMAVALAEVGRFSLALKIACGGELGGWQWNALEAIGFEQIEAGELVAALQTAQEIDPQHPGGERVRFRVVEAHTRAGNPEAAVTAAQTLAPGNREKLLGQIALAQQHAGQLSDALTTASRIEPGGFRTDTLQEIAVAQLRMGNPEAARAVFADAISATQAIESDWLRRNSLRRLAAAQAAVGESGDALETAKMIDDKLDQVKALGRIAVSHAEGGDAESARGVLTAAREIAQEMEWDSDEADEEIAAALAEVGEFAAAFETVARIDTERVRDRALGKIAKAQARAHEYGAALETAQSIRDERGVRDSALVEIAREQIRAEQYDAALETSQLLNRGSGLVMVITEIATALVEAGKTEAARVAVDNFQDSRAWRSSDELEAIAVAQARVGNLAAAVETAQRITIFGDERERVLRSIAEIQGPIAFGAVALKGALALLEDRNKRLPEIAAVLLRTGDTESFKRLLIPCAFYVDAAYRMCALLVRLYPEQAEEIAGIVVKHAVRDLDVDPD
jgi:tetratricopeptide (TPR) repeat protein